jgi:hypothetical protein
LQCRVDDEAFIETMNVGSSFMHDDITIEAWEECEDIDEEGEGLIEPTAGMFGGGMPMFGGGMTDMAGMGGMTGMGSMPAMGGMAGMAGMGDFEGMAGMGGPSYGGVFGRTMGVSVSGVYGAMGASPGGFVASLDSMIPPSIQDVDEEEAKEDDELKNAEV